MDTGGVVSVPVPCYRAVLLAAQTDIINACAEQSVVYLSCVWY